MKKIILTIFLLFFPIKAIAHLNFSEPTDLRAKNLYKATILFINDSVEEFAVIAHSKEYDKAFYPLQKCYKTYFRQDPKFPNSFAAGLAKCLAVDYSMTRSVNEANQQAIKEGRPQPYNIPFFEWSAFEKRIEQAGIPKNYIVFHAKDATMEKANHFSKTTMTKTGYSEYTLFIWLNYCPEKFNEMVRKIFAIP